MSRRARPFNRRADVRVPALFGGPLGGRRPVYLDEVDFGTFGLGDDVVATFNASVEQWRSDIENAAGDMPVSFLLMWIQKESNGNPCSYTSLQEAGIMQLMAGDNMAQGQTSMAQQHPSPPCTPGTQTTAYRSSLTDEQAGWQVDGGLTYVRYCRDRARAYLAQFGYAGQPGWTESDWSFWAMVKMVHVAPAKIPGMLQAGINGAGGVPADWDAMMRFVTGIPASWTDNARAVGIYGQGGGTVFNKQTLGYVMIGAGALALIYLARRHARRVAH
jgi:hypothetical protein